MNPGMHGTMAPNVWLALNVPQVSHHAGRRIAYLQHAKQLAVPRDLVQIGAGCERIYHARTRTFMAHAVQSVP